MKTSLVFTALALISVPAHAQNGFSFEINGRAVHIAVPRHCDDEQCLSISTSRAGPATAQDGEQRIDTSKIVGMLSDLMARRRDRDDGSLDDSSARAQPPASVITKEATIETAPAPPENTAPSVTAPMAPSAKVDVATPPPVAAAEYAPPSPIGVWLTQNKEGKVHIVACGSNYCGYAVDSRSAQDGAKVLIDMKTVTDRQWSGSVHDPKGGGTYDATMALKSPDTLAIRGCAFGGMICRGQTWSRV